MKRTKNQVCRFSVAGRRDFPFDMLRYDRCFPVSSGDAAKLHFNGYEDDRNEIRQLKLETVAYSITPDRWASFGWHVVQQKNERGDVMAQTPLYTEPKLWGVG